MKLKHLLPLLGMALPLCMQAVPADPTPMKVVNPDGKVVSLINYGDEFFNYRTDADGNKIMTQDAKGYWTPMMVDGKEFQATASNIQYLRNMRMDKKFYESTDETRMALLDDDGRTTYPTTGESRALCILIEYKDTKFAIKNAQEEISKKLNQEGYSGYGGQGSARDYFVDASLGNFHVTFDVSRIVTLPETSAYYVARGVDGVPSPGTIGRITEAFQYAVKELDSEIDYSLYDADNDGNIDNIFFYYAGYGQANSPYADTIWPHQSDYNVYCDPRYSDYYYNLNIEEVIVDGKKFCTYACGNELNYNLGPSPTSPYLDGIGTFCHEYGHVLGFPDFYDTADGNTEVPGDFDLMCNGSYNQNSTLPPTLSGYERWVCHWLEYEDILEPGTFTMESLEKSNKAYRLGIPTRTGKFYKNEYFILEGRGKDHWDKSLPDHGIAIWHVRYNAASWKVNTPNVNNDPRYRIIRPPHTKQQNYYCWNELNPNNYAGTTYSLTPKDVISTWFKYQLSAMSYDTTNDTFSFDYTNEVNTNDVTTEFTQFFKDSNNREIHIGWKPVEGATGYLLSVLRFTTQGSRIDVNDLNETSVGNVDHYVLTNLASGDWNTEAMTVILKVVMDVPSSKNTGPYTFRPKSLPEVGPDSVEDIYGEDFVVIGGNGCIYAPDDAVVYNLSGVCTGKDNLAAGVYIVRQGAKAVKVTVK